MNCNIDICVTVWTLMIVNELDEYKQHILTSQQKYFSFVFKYRKNLFPVILGCTQSILLHC